MKNGYEFQNKNVKKKFLETNIGKKANNRLWLMLSLTIVFGIVAYVTWLIIKDHNDLYYVLALPGGLVAVSLVLAIYYDGLRDGAVNMLIELGVDDSGGEEVTEYPIKEDEDINTELEAQHGESVEDSEEIEDGETEEDK